MAQPCEQPGEGRDQWINGRSGGAMGPGLRRGG